MKPDKIKKLIMMIIPAAVLVALSAYLLQGDVWTFWTWYLLALVLGVAAMPLTGRLFRRFDDKGWIFSKVTAIAITGFLTWFLVTVKILKFTAVTCVAVTVIGTVLSILLYRKEQKDGFECIPFAHLNLVYAEELLFFAFFLMWTYFAGFHPAAYGTEKFMDYGFMEAMMRSKTLPATDLWYSEGKINYYYGGQYFAVFLTKLSGTKVELTYNLMRTFVAGLAFIMPFSLVHQMVKDRLGRNISGWKKKLPSVTGFLAGIAVSVAGNMHYVVYACVIPWIQKLKGEEVSSYWFPDATRYIGFNPDVADKTIHEFPCYSWRSACTCCGYHVCSFDPCIALCLDEKSKNNKDHTREYREKRILAQTASDATASGSCSPSGNVPLDKLLGFCHLLYSDLWSDPDHEYYRTGRKGKMDPCRDSSTGSGDPDTGNTDHPSVYDAV